MSRIHLEELADDLKNIYQLNPAGSEAMIEKYLGERLKELSPDERLPFIEKLTQALAESKASRVSIPYQGVLDFPCPEPVELPTQGVLDSPCPKSAELSKLLSLLMGKDAASQHPSSTKLLTELTSSLDTIYDTLNQITDIIDTVLLGRRTEIEPIGQIIGSIFDKTDQSLSLKDCLDRIKDAFLIAQQGFREAVQSRVGEILFELDPERLEAASIRGFKFGPMRKAELFEIYKEKYQTCQSWFESGHLVEEVLREFEKACQKTYSDKTQK